VSRFGRRLAWLGCRRPNDSTALMAKAADVPVRGRPGRSVHRSRRRVGN